MQATIILGHTLPNIVPENSLKEIALYKWPKKIFHGVIEKPFNSVEVLRLDIGELNCVILSVKELGMRYEGDFSMNYMFIECLHNAYR